MSEPNGSRLPAHGQDLACAGRLSRVAFFNPFRPAYVEDPYPALARLRAEAPVHWSPELDAWILTRYADCLEVLQNDESFSSDPARAGGTFGETISARRAIVPLGKAPIMGNSDPPVHDQLRAIVNRCFTPRVMDAAREAVRINVEALIADGEEGASFDVMRGLAEPLAVSTVLRHLGIPPDGWERVRGWSLAMMRVRAEGQDSGLFRAAEEARGEMLDYLARLAEMRAKSGNDRPGDVLDALLEAADAEAIDADELLMMLLHISLAGNGPTAMAVGNAVRALGESPEQLKWLTQNLESLPAAVEELLRFDPSTHFVARFAVTDTTVGGRTIRKGQQVHVMVGAANRDPERFADPDVLDLTRSENRHLTFGYGIHFCLGAPLARIELENALKGVLERFGTYEVVSADRGGTYQLRGLTRLEIRRRDSE